MSKKELTLIVATDKNGLIGKENGLPWHLPEDLKYFKKNTVGKTVVMGFNTFESIGRPLPKRKNVVLTRKEIEIEDVFIIHSIEDILLLNEEEDLMIMGGKQLYEQMLPFANKILLTKIEASFNGDTYLNLDLSDFVEVSKEKGLKNEDNPEDYYYLVYQRK